MNRKSRKKRTKEWDLTYTEFNPQEEKLRETLTTVGNGYFGTRGCFESERTSENHYPGTYIAGVFNKVPSIVHGKEIFNDDFVNCPNWLPVEIKIGNGKFTSPLKMKILDYEQNLNLRHGVLERRITFENTKGQVTTIESQRFASMSNKHMACLRFTVTPENYSAPLALKSSLDGTVFNDGVARYRNLNSKHLSLVSRAEFDKGIYLHVKTNESHIRIAVFAKNILSTNGKPLAEKRKIASEDGFIAELMTFDATRGKQYTLDKIVAITTSRDENIANEFSTGLVEIERNRSFEAMLRSHKNAWKSLWEKADMQIEGDRLSQKVTRLHIYHLLCTLSPHNAHIDAGLPARGLSGEAYRGHIFWDSIYALPFFYQRFPEIAKSAIMYRYRRLDAARTYARQNGYEGAMFPWQSSNDGTEETQVIHYNPVSGKWDPDLSCRQRHISIAIFYNVWMYYYHTMDEEFLHSYGAEMLLEIARFWASISTWDARSKRYHIYGVMGPDEFHEKYPNASLEKGGINDNAYTNIMTVWVLERALELAKKLPEEIKSDLAEKINFSKEETKKWHDITHRMYVPITDDGIISQFEGYMDLADIDWDHYRNKYGNIHRMDRILKSEGDSPDHYKVAKQADALMTFFVLPLDEVCRLLKQLGYSVGNEKEFLARNYDFHVVRTSHGSTLSKVAHSAVSKYRDTSEETWKWFLESLESDIHDTQGGTTIEGIHCAVMGGTITIVTRVFAGVSFEEGIIDVNPSLPSHWKKLSFKLLIRGCWYSFEITQDTINVTMDATGKTPVATKVNNTTMNVC
ncbi:MAG: beta-phosphoglucomutase [Chitinivibrionales bacterium]|nr:beta-phosphoglucomutase [Chitinivibrionales bacterium]